MRLKVVCELDSEELPKDYRRKILSLMKIGLNKVNPTAYQELFESNKRKNYTWAVFFKNAVFNKETITIPDKQFILNFSTGDAEKSVLFYNAFTELLNEEVKISGKTFQITDVEAVPQPKIRTNHVIFKTLSPIVVREHSQSTKKDWFWSVTQNETKFLDVLKQNLLYKLESNSEESLKTDIEQLSFKPIKMKKTVVSHYDKQIEGSIGTFELTGASYLLNEFQQSGVGSVTGGGFGFVERID
ncbi:CRISPR-associated endoribonuclease Cas6 [Carnobacterium gallinarum]|uniref:CRISPR-associated endoribonuclease Cas6 n=1 Tax=Carnobacterium gallinarum TaxID=2749 RepID=UPI0005516A7D|nr:CRISPR-associated endoribonuclease Cas6 [Carnobacterium gallinarum]